MGRAVAIAIFFFTLSLGAFSEGSNKKSVLNISSSSVMQANAQPPPIGKSYFFEPENLHVLEVAIENHVGKPEVFEDLVEAYFYNKKLYLPLEQLFTIFEFPIVVKLKQGTAQGWFFRENYAFSMSLADKLIKAKSQTYSFDSGQVVKGKEDLYVESSLLTEATGIKFEHDPKLMRLIVEPPEPFPAIAFRNRTKKLGQSRGGQKKDTSDYKKIEGKYENLTMPLFNVSLSNSLAIKPKLRNSFDYTITETNHMLGFASTGFLTGKGDKLNNINFNLNKTNAKGGLLGPLNASSYSIGDTNTIQVPLAASASAGVGINVSNSPIIQAANLDATSFTGYQQPGWQAELYRNDSLIEFIVVGENGFYEFKDIPLNFGVNKFKMVFYGPQGQQIEETKTINTSTAVLTSGEKRYMMFAGEKNKKLFESVLGTKAKEKGKKLSGLFEYGLAKGISARMGFNSMDFYKKATTGDRSEDRNYFSLGIATTKIQPILLIADYAYDTEDKGHAAKVSALTNVYNINIRADHTYLSHFYSEIYNPSSGAEMSNISTLDLRSNIKKIEVGLNFKKEIFKDHKRYNDYISNQLSRNFGKLGIFSNSLDYKKQVTATSKSTTLTGAFLYRIQISKGTSLRSNINYGLRPDRKINSLGVTVNHRFNDDLSGSFGVTKSDNTYSFSSGVAWKLEKAQLGFTASGSNKNSFSIGMTLNFALFREPATRNWQIQRDSVIGRAPVSAYHFLDTNQNGIHDEKEKILDEIGLYSRSKQTQNAKYVSILSNVSPHNEFDLESDEKKLDYEHAPMYRGITISPKQGAFTQVAIPIIYAGEVEGEVYLKGEDSEDARPAFKADIELVDSDGKVVATKKTEPDGYFLFERVRIGRYNLRLSKEYLRRYQSHSEGVSLQISKEEINSVGNKLIIQRE